MKFLKILGLVAVAMVFLSCNQSPSKAVIATTDGETSTTYLSNDTIAKFRKTINPKAVASFSEPIKDEFNKWEFAVSLYETKETFKYALNMRYKEINVNDILNIPNFGIVPKILLQKGTTKNSCIIGFTDKEGNFKEYKKVEVKNEQLKLVGLKSYFVGVYKTKLK